MEDNQIKPVRVSEYEIQPTKATDKQPISEPIAIKPICINYLTLDYIMKLINK